MLKYGAAVRRGGKPLSRRIDVCIEGDLARDEIVLSADDPDRAAFNEAGSVWGKPSRSS